MGRNYILHRRFVCAKRTPVANSSEFPYAIQSIDLKSPWLIVLVLVNKLHLRLMSVGFDEWPKSSFVSIGGQLRVGLAYGRNWRGDR